MLDEEQIHAFYKEKAEEVGESKTKNITSYYAALVTRRVQ